MKTFKDIALSFILDGVGALESAKAEGVSDDVFLKAFEAVQASKQVDSTPFEAWVATNIDLSGTPGRGRPALEMGQTRVYKAQRVGGEGSAFIRLPVELLGCRKGSPVKVTVENGRMIVEKDG